MSGINEATDWRVFILKKPKRRGDGVRIIGFIIIITETRRAFVIARIWLNRDGPRSGPRSRKGFEDICEAAVARVFVG